MKKIALLLVMMFVCVLMTKAQNFTIDHFKGGGTIAVLTNGAEVDITPYPMWRQFERKYTIQENINRRLQELYREDPEEYFLQARAYQERGGVVFMPMASGVGNPMMNGVMVPGGMMMAGNGGYVFGSGGAASAQSQVVIDNKNLMATAGSGLQAYYDTGSNSLSISGDPLQAAGRLYEFIVGSGKKNKQTVQQVVYVDRATGQQIQTRAAQGQQVQQTNGGFSNGQVLRDAQGNAYIVNNGVLYPVQQQTTRSQQQTTNNYGGVATQPVYNVASDY